MIGVALIAAAALAGPACTPLPGFDAVLDRPGITFVVFGEAHGTVEAPGVFLDAVCAAAARGPVTAALEFTPADQKALDGYMTSDGGSDAHAALLEAPAWADRGGRQSQALAGLIEDLRRLKASGAAVELQAFDAAPTSEGTNAAREEGMARALIDVASRRPGPVLVLTGSGHADRTGWNGPPAFRSAAQALPASQTLSLFFARPGGEYWTCRAPDGGGETECRAWPMPVREPVGSRGVRLTPDARQGFDGIFSAGRPYTASPPARP